MIFIHEAKPSGLELERDILEDEGGEKNKKKERKILTVYTFCISVALRSG